MPWLQSLGDLGTEMTISPGRAKLLSTVSHAEFLRWVIGYAKRQGWRVKCDHDSRKEDWESDSGWPDVFCVRGERAIALELKVGRDRVKPEQRAWLSALTVAGIDVYVAWPTDEETIRAELA